MKRSTFDKKLANGEIEVNAWSEDGNEVDITVIKRNGNRERKIVRLTGPRWEGE